MAYLLRLGERILRIETTASPGGRVAARVVDGEAARPLSFDVSRQGRCLAARLDDGRSVEAYVERRDGRTTVWLDGSVYELDLVDERAARRRRGGAADLGGPQTVKAPMPGKVVKLLVAVGDRVEVGQGVVVVEAMKMENELRAPAAGVVKALPVAEGTPVESGTALVVLE